MSKFFINRPIVAIVIAVLTVIVGAISIVRLPVSQFPSIVPPETKIQATFVGADAQTLAQSVATPIEEQMSGVDNMNYMYSVNATANGQTTMIVDFGVETDPNTDLILTQMRETQAAAQLPSTVAQYGVTVQKSTSAPMMLVALDSPHGSYDAQFLANYEYINLVDPITRVPGIASVTVFGAGQYAMRIWIKPDLLAKLGITASDVVNAVESQNTVNPAGQIGSPPTPAGQEFTYSVRAQGRLVKPEEFGNIIVRENPNGGVVRVRDVARVELGVQSYTLMGRLNGKPSAIMAIYQIPGSNAVDDAKGVRALMAQWRPRFPVDMEYVVSLDQTKAVTEGMREILLTLGIALVLVIVVVYVFLQGWRATLIPLLAVPVSLVGTFAFFPLFGFSINTLSMFGLVLAIGLVVDDAIVVVESVERHIEEGLAPKEAALKAMEEISGPVIGIALVLSAVFVPTAFVPGITGRLYQQFAVTIAISVVISAFNALSLSPALAALLLRPKKPGTGLLRRFFDWFNRGFLRVTNGYIQVSAALIRKSTVAVVVLLLFGVVAIMFGRKLPSGFLPDEDQGYVYVNIQLPLAASLQRTDQAAREVEAVLARTPGVQYTTSVIGFSLLSYVQTSYNAFFFVTLDPWEDRKQQAEQFQAIKYRLNQELPKLPQGTAFSFSPPAIPGVGTSGGFTFVLEDRGGNDISYLAANVDKFLAAAGKRPEIAGINSSLLPSVPQEFADVDREKVLKQGVPISDVYTTLQTYMGGLFVNYFNSFGRQWQVYVEAEGDYRTKVQDAGQFYVRNSAGAMVPLSALTKFEPRFGPEFVMHYNEYPAAQINGNAAPGYSSDQATAALEQVFAQTMPHDMAYDYMGMSFQQKQAEQGTSSTTIFGFSILFVFLILAALYESWSLPFSVLLSTPVAVFGAFGILLLRRLFTQAVYPAYMVQIENDVYSQIGLVMLIGLAAKNAILIVEFAKDEYEKGKPLVEAALGGARLRLRPILMTSLAFIFGCIPLWLASGAGSVARQIMGTTVIGGMLAASAIAIFFIPAIFYFVEKLSGGKRHDLTESSAGVAPQEGN
ncbi:MAG TPA: multidrug efflux RND transporter permease subunit [Candidatus Acidoferrales bacterium]|jgi:hydrophobe/amphiphile efflux-1 (HAE1) family protein|nr:multidrug efflux RND transporter permease subunit [Candidatus Acidoferrales bacterium]